MNNIIVDVNNYNEELENIELGKKIITKLSDGGIMNKYYIYMMTEFPENLIIKSPPIRLIYNHDNNYNKYNNISIPLYPTYNKLKKFVKLINKLENYIQEMINKPELTFVSNIKKNNNIKNIKLNTVDKLDNINSLKSGGTVELAINPSHVWMINNKYGIYYNLVQIKYEEPIEIKKHDFFNLKPSKIDFVSQPVSKPSLNPFIPSLDILMDQKSKLKKVDD